MANGVTYQFLPWVRSGLAAQLPDPDTLGAGIPGRAHLDVDVTVTRQAGPPIPVTRRIVVTGPGDVTGIDQRQIIRTDPKPDATDFEPNFLAAVEFDRPDFPWLFTPAAANAQAQLRPWLVLVVVERGEGVSLTVEPRRPLPVLTIEPGARPSRQLPDLAESWAWAHGQVVVAGAEELDDLLAGRPERTASRLVCPRRLDPDTSYLACVVPAFEAGRLAGLGLPPAAEDETLRPAWTARADTTTALPVYFSWAFTTGQGGDFEALARALRARPIPPEVGSHDVFVGAAGAPLPALAREAPAAVVELRGALVPPDTPAAPWPAATRQELEQGLRGVLDLPANRLGSGGPAPTGPAVTPPLYGRWLAAQPTVPPPNAGPHWLRTQNLDPRHRAVAGLSTRVVQAEQERLMEEAWAQVGEIERANRELRWAQLAVHVRGSLLRRHVAPLPPGRLTSLTRPAHRRLLAGETTVAATARESALPEATLSPQFRRTVRPRGPLARRVYAPDERTIRPLVEGLDTGALAAAPPARQPDGLFGFATTAPARPDVPAAVRDQVASAAAAGASRRPRPVSAGQLRASVVTDARAATMAGVIVRGERAGGLGPVVPTPAAQARALAERFKAAAVVTVEHADLVSLQPAETPRPPLDVGAVQTEVLARLDPARTVQARVLDRVRIPAELRPIPPEDPLDEVLAAPVFPQPAWELLRDRFPDHLLPGLEHVPQNTVSLMQTNPQYVEAFLVGLNHELGRELLWREYPTDQRGTGFRRFWAAGGRDDIPPIHEWDAASDLGSSLAGGPQGHLVLLIRGELLRRYPSTMIYAAPDLNGRPQLADEAVKLPLFRGRLDPDVTFAGFDLTPDDAGSRWWFVFEDQPTEPRFALDVADGFGADAPPLNQWNDLTWGHLAADEAALDALSHISVAGFTPPAPPPAGPRWGDSSAAMAAIVVQQPVRISLRGADLLPPAPAPPPPQ